jgi:hypothetical protein
LPIVKKGETLLERHRPKRPNAKELLSQLLFRNCFQIELSAKASSFLQLTGEHWLTIQSGSSYGNAIRTPTLDNAFSNNTPPSQRDVMRILTFFKNLWSMDTPDVTSINGKFSWNVITQYYSEDGTYSMKGPGMSI